MNEQPTTETNSPINEALKTLEAYIDELNSLIGELNQRLEPISTPIPPTEEKTGVAVDDNPSDLRRCLIRSSAHVRIGIGNVKRTIEHLEL